MRNCPEKIMLLSNSTLLLRSEKCEAEGLIMAFMDRKDQTGYFLSKFTFNERACTLIEIFNEASL